MTQLLSVAKELLKCIQNQRLKWKENQTIIATDFTQICSPSEVWSFNPFTPKSDLIDFILSNARRFYSSKGGPSGVKGLRKY